MAAALLLGGRVHIRQARIRWRSCLRAHALQPCLLCSPAAFDLRHYDESPEPLLLLQPCDQACVAVLQLQLAIAAGGPCACHAFCVDDTASMMHQGCK